MFKLKHLYKRARALEKTIVFPEASFSPRTLEAIKIIADKKIAKPILIGDESAIILADKKLAKFQIINPKTFDKTDQLAKALYQKRKDKGVTLEQAQEMILNPYYFATMLVGEGYADGIVGGAECSSADMIRPALQIIKAEKKDRPVTSCFLICGKSKLLNDRAIIVGDCGLIQEPTADELVTIAGDCTRTFKQLGLPDEPKVAFLSYSTHGSGKGESVDKVKDAATKFKKFEKTIASDGEIQLDAALNPRVAKIKCQTSQVEGNANILIYPDLNSGNIGYKTIQYFGQLHAIGPILQGLKKPANDLSRGCSVEDIVAMTAITAIQANSKKNKENKQ